MRPYEPVSIRLLRFNYSKNKDEQNISIKVFDFFVATTELTNYLYGLLETQSFQAVLYGLLDTHVAARATRSAACHSLQQPLCCSVLASRAFCFHVPKLWNVLPPSLRQSVVQPVTVDTFKRNLKALHFSTAFNFACQTV